MRLRRGARPLAGRVLALTVRLSALWLAFAISAAPLSASAPPPAPNQTEQALELQYAKLTKQAKGDIEKLEERIKKLVQETKAAADQTEKPVRFAEKISQLLDQVMARVGGDDQGPVASLFLPTPAPGTTPAAKALAQILKNELARVGVSLSPDRLQELAGAITKGGREAVSLALQIATAIAEASVDPARGGVASIGSGRADGVAALKAALSRLGCPSSFQGSLEQSAQMSGPMAASYWKQSIDKSLKICLGAIEAKITKLGAEVVKAKQEIAKLEKQLAELGQEREKALQELRERSAKHRKSLQQQLEESIRQATATPTPRRP